MKSKKGVSDIVITVSMILISIVAVGVISAFVIPMIKGQLAKSSACMSLREHFQVRTDLSATCYDPTAGQIKLSIQRGAEKEEAKGFSVVIFTSEGEAEAYQILNGTEGYSNVPGLPNRQAARVYTLPVTGNVEKVTINTILPTDQACDAMDYTGIRHC